MMGTRLRFERSQGEGRFYNPVKARRNQQLQKAMRTAGIPIPETSSSACAAKKIRVPEDEGSEERSKCVPASVPVSNTQTTPPGGNLDRFLESTTPCVPAQYLSKTRMRGWKTCDVEFQPFFTLGDLWESFKEWSAYGAGVPLVLDGSDSVVQYYVPYLSSIQLYADASRNGVRQRRPCDDSDGDYYRDSSSDGSSDYEFERGLKLAKEQWGRLLYPAAAATLRTGRFSTRQKHVSFQEGLSSDDSDGGNSETPCLIFKYSEQDPPYSGEPLANKIADLSHGFPDLNALRSCDLRAPSWMSVAWYPIYRIPTGPTLQDLDACFLTYHSLSTPMRATMNDLAPIMNSVQIVQGYQMISLPTFGLATYKFKGSVWMPNGGSEIHHVSSLLQAADNWLRMLQSAHPDFQFFASHGMLWRG